jgi:TolB-like protein/cytochrome c-type biogenesis protein CcmH/NrfG
VESERLVADGLHESIITQLSKVGDLSVISRTSVMPYRGAMVAAEEVGRELNVATVLEGTVRHAGGQLRVAVQLVRTRDGVQMWADQYDTPYAVEEVFAIQSDIAERIASALNATLSAAEREQIRAEPTTSLEALEAYYRGNAAYEGRYEQAEAERAVDAYEEAVRLDPAFGLAYAALAESRVWLAWQFAAGDAEIAAAEAALEEAMDLAPGAFQTLMAQGQVRYRADRDYDAALVSFQKAIELAPSDFSGHMSVGSIYRRRGEWEQAIAYFERASALSPRDPTLLYTLGHTNHLARRFEEANRWFTNLAAVSPRIGSQGPVFGRFELLSSMGDTAAARQLVEQIPDSEHGVRDRLAATLAFFGREFETALSANAPLQFVPLAGEIDRELSDAMIYHAMSDSVSVRLMADSSRLRADAELESLALAHPNQLSGVYGRMGMAHALLGNRVAALQAGDLGMRSLPLETDAYTGRFGLQRMALIRLYLGDIEEAIELLEQLSAVPSEITPALLRLDPRWDSLRGNPRFDALAAGRTPSNP